MAEPCTHALEIPVDTEPSGDGCEECLRDGTRWVKLRMCQDCGHVGCCDSSPGKHATGHFEETAHPLMSSFEPGESWFWCYVDELSFELVDGPEPPSHS